MIIGSETAHAASQQAALSIASKYNVSVTANKQVFYARPKRAERRFGGVTLNSEGRRASPLPAQTSPPQTDRQMVQPHPTGLQTKPILS